MRKLFLLLSFLLFACEVPKVENASFAFVSISEIKLNSKTIEGSSNHNFKDAWVFVDGATIGVYELPRRIPIAIETAGQSTLLSIQAGIRDNGINSAPTVFPFVGNYEVNLDLTGGEELGLIPEFEYLEATIFRLIADFETSNLISFDEDGDSTTTLVISNEEFSTGIGSGKMAVAAGGIMEQASTLVYDDFPVNGSPIYVEIDYKGNMDLDLGLIGINGQQLFKDYFVSLRSSEEWKKTYINLTDLIIASNFEGYQLLLGIDNTNGGTEAQVYVDNIKLLHF